MNIFTQALRQITHQPSTVACFLVSCRYHFHSSIIPEMLSNEKFSKTLLGPTEDFPEANKCFHKLFVLSDTMQFASLMHIYYFDGFEQNVLSPLLNKMKYFSTTLQKCRIDHSVNTTELYKYLSRVRTLREVVCGGFCNFNLDQLKIILSEFDRLESFECGFERTIKDDDNVAFEKWLNEPQHHHSLCRGSQSLRNLKLNDASTRLMETLLSKGNFANLRHLVLSPVQYAEELNVQKFLPRLPNLTSFRLICCKIVGDDHLFRCANNNPCKLPHLQSVIISNCSNITRNFLDWLLIDSGAADGKLREFVLERPTMHPSCAAEDFSFLKKLTNLEKLKIEHCESFVEASLSNIKDLTELKSVDFVNCSALKTSSSSMLTVFQNIHKLEHLSFQSGGNPASSSSSSLSRPKLIPSLFIIPSSFVSSSHFPSEKTASGLLKTLELCNSNMNDDDLEGISSFKNSLEELSLGLNREITDEGLMRHRCSELVNLKKLDLSRLVKLTDISFLKNMRKLENLVLQGCKALTDDSFRVFSEKIENTSSISTNDGKFPFPELHTLNMAACDSLTVNVLKHFAENDNLTHSLTTLNLELSFDFDEENLTDIQEFMKNLGRLRGLRSLDGIYDAFSEGSISQELYDELTKSLKNLDDQIW